MKVRLAKKIMKQQVENSLPRHKASKYWYKRWSSFERFRVALPGICDHRIPKAISLTEKKEVRNDSTRAD